jgi:hypothetical protein
MQMKSDILKDKPESERNEIWYVIAYRYTCILSFHTLTCPKSRIFLLMVYSQYCKHKLVFKTGFRMHVSSFIHRHSYIFTTDMGVFYCVALS